MQIACPNCKTTHEINSPINRDDNTVVRCTNCGKNIKIQICPYCNAFYSITFSNIKSGDYTFKCKKCDNNFTVKISDTKETVQEKKIDDKPQSKPTEKSKPIEKSRPTKKNKPTEKTISTEKTKPTEKIISTEKSKPTEFSVSELFRYVSEAFTGKKIIVSAVGVTSMLVLLQIVNLIMDSAAVQESIASLITGSIMNFLPVAIIFLFYILSASIVAKITLNHIFHSRDTGAEEIVKFTARRGLGIFCGNIVLLLAVSSLLILFGKIPLLGPVLFSLIFLPIYLISLGILIFSFIGLWFYPPIAANDESGFLMNIKSLLLFIKRHNLNIIFMIPVIFLSSAIIFAVIFIIHIAAFSFTTSLSQIIIGQDAVVILSSVPAQLIKASQATLMGIKSGLFKDLFLSLQVTHHIGGFILGIIFLVIAIFLLAIPISVASTVSTHIYVLMERKISIDDKTKALVLFILVMLIILIILINKVWR